ncbi:hypothetical protein [Prauserella rugosa]|uniref:DUF8017 domain-containing protein n=1 Tax=Prauserella rugosa TaxID=43354 RepID=A0A660C9I6_9PSEU|nr:hypothetical protein [Prauserella rugosa]KID30488.1 hypothetical protein HQ32_01989 [Prauserella sp. Am3]TWH20218.1 hypothetical protein JD82_02060 [Prauserella rugosa]
MVFWRRRNRDQRSEQYGYRDNAALDGVGGYEPSDPNDAYRPPEPHRSPWAGAQTYPQPSSPESVAPGQAYPGRTVPGQQPYPGQQSYPGQQPYPGQQAQGYGAQPSQASPQAQQNRKSAKQGCGGGIGCLVVIVAIVSTIIGNARNDDDTADSDARDTDTVETTEQSSSPSTSEPPVDVAPVVEGWQPVVATSGAFAYDVPPAWQPKPGTVHGWEAGSGYDDRMALSTSAFAGRECDDATHRNGAGVAVYAPPEEAGESNAKAADALLTEVAQRAYSDGDTRPEIGRSMYTVGTFGEAGQGMRVMTSAYAEVTPTSPGGCVPERAWVGVTLVPGQERGGESAALVVYADHAAMDQDQLNEMLRTLRPVS